MQSSQENRTKIDFDRNLLIIEIDRQMQILSAMDHITDVIPSEHVVTTLSDEGHEYIDVLSRLRKIVTDIWGICHSFFEQGALRN